MKMDNFSSSFYPLYKIFFMLGLAPYDLNLNYITHTPASDSRQKQLLSILIVIAITAISEYGRSTFMSNAVVDSKTTFLILALNSYSVGPITSVGIIFAHWKFYKIHVESINFIYEVDQIFSKYGIETDHNSEKKRALLAIVAAQVAIFYHDFQLNFVTFPRKDFSYLVAILCLQLASIAFVTIIAQFIAWASALVDRLAKLNQLMAGCDEEAFLRVTGESCKGSELCSVHRKLCEIMDKLAYVYSVPIVLEHGMLFLTLVVDTYFIYRNYVVAKNGVGSYYLASVLLTKDIFFVLLLYIVCDKAHSVIFQAEKTGAIMHNQTIQISNKKAKKTISICSLQLLQQKAHFNICGMFPLDLSCFGSIIGFVTSYLIVYIQFQGSS